MLCLAAVAGAIDDFIGWQVAHEVVDWMVKTGLATDRAEATQFGQLLLLGNYIHPIDEQSAFEDKTVLFRLAAVTPPNRNSRTCARLTTDKARRTGPSITSLIEAV